MNYVEHAAAYARTEIVSVHTGLHSLVYRRDVTERKVDNVYVIPYPRAVVRGVVVAEHSHFFEFAYRDFGDIRSQIVGYAFGVLADKSAGVRPYGIEIS